MEAVNSKVHIRVDLTDVDIDTLRKNLGPAIVAQILRAWNMLISTFQYMSVLTQILTAASPS